MAFEKFDVLRATASQLRGLLEEGKVTSVDIVKTYLGQIARHNHDGLKLNAVINTAPESFLLEEAQALDVERRKSGPRSRLHGIPILLKDQFCSPSFNLPTTGGSLALKGIEAKEDATIPRLLRKAGAIIIATANLSELGNAKGYNITAGWSPVGGQTQTPYVEGGVDPKGKWLGHSTPAGSSSGSAAGVAAGFAPWSIGTELDGSIVQPALRAALYSLKPTPGHVDLMKGSQAEGSLMTGIGGLARSAQDLADLTSAVLPGTDFGADLTTSWEGFGIANLNFDEWHYPDSVSEVVPDYDKQSREEIESALAKIKSLGARVTHNAPLMTPQDVGKKKGVPSASSLVLYETRLTLENWFAGFKSSPVHTLEDLIQFNKDHAEDELPVGFNQDHLEAAAKSSMTPEDFKRDFRLLTEEMRENVENCLSLTNSDVIVASGESVLTTIAMAAGYPVASAPLSFAKFNGRPFGIEILAREGEEGKLLKFLSAWNATFPQAVKPPPLLSSGREPVIQAEL